jgi:hypothetical protein
MAEMLTPAEAASHAAANYVYTASHKQGFADGWAAGWAAAVAEAGAKVSGGSEALGDCVAGGVKEDSEGDKARVFNEHGEEGNCNVRYELDGIWAAYFAASEAAREEAVAVAAAAERKRDNNNKVDLGGAAASSREAWSMRCYGVRGAREILEFEAKEEERFTQSISEVSSPLWPVVAVGDVSGSRH